MKCRVLGRLGLVGLEILISADRLSVLCCAAGRGGAGSDRDDLSQRTDGGDHRNFTSQSPIQSDISLSYCDLTDMTG